jgi:glucose-1-phosphate thymidylyltransferase
MIYYPIQAWPMRDSDHAGYGWNSAGVFEIAGQRKDFSLKRLNYTYQEGEGGIADALRLAEHFVDGEPVCVILGDNIIEGNIARAADAFRKQQQGAKILLKEVKDPQRFGVPILEGDRVVKIEEKPANPRSSYAVTGMYFYDARVFDIIKTLKPSGRGELEITDVNNAYIADGTLTWDILEGWWTDAGTIESLHLANQLVAKTGANKL